MADKHTNGKADGARVMRCAFERAHASEAADGLSEVLVDDGSGGAHHDHVSVLVDALAGRYAD
jgi:hypothetical protein